MGLINLLIRYQTTTRLKITAIIKPLITMLSQYLKSEDRKTTEDTDEVTALYLNAN